MYDAVVLLAFSPWLKPGIAVTMTNDSKATGHVTHDTLQSTSLSLRRTCTTTSEVLHTQTPCPPLSSCGVPTWLHRSRLNNSGWLQMLLLEYSRSSLLALAIVPNWY